MAIEIEQKIDYTKYEKYPITPLEAKYLTNVNSTLFLSQKMLKVPPYSNIEVLIKKLLKYRENWSKTATFSDNYMFHINNLIKWALKYWNENQQTNGNYPRDEHGNYIDRSQVLDIAGGIINLQMLINWDTNNGCLTPNENTILTNTLNKK